MAMVKRRCSDMDTMGLHGAGVWVGLMFIMAINVLLNSFHSIELQSVKPSNLQGFPSEKEIYWKYD